MQLGYDMGKELEREEKVEPDTSRLSQVFSVYLRLETEHGKPITEEEVKKWVEEQFEGCDLCSVKVNEVIEHNF